MNSDTTSNAAATGIVGVILLVYFIIIVAVIAFTIWIYWRIFAKAGYNGALSLLNLVPGVGPLICSLRLWMSPSSNAGSNRCCASDKQVNATSRPQTSCCPRRLASAARFGRNAAMR